jgi:hypothetical protein
MCRDIFGIFHIVFNKNQYLTLKKTWIVFAILFVLFFSSPWHWLFIANDRDVQITMDHLLSVHLLLWQNFVFYFIFIFYYV